MSLKDRTNATLPLKTFTRRAKPQQTGEGAADDIRTPELEPRGLADSSSKSQPASCGSSLRGNSPALPSMPSIRGLGWLLNGLNNRRSSVLLPFASLLEAADYLAQRKGSRKEREHRQLAYMATVAELSVQYAEVDAFELVVESPGNSPEEERRKGRSRRYQDPGAGAGKSGSQAAGAVDVLQEGLQALALGPRASDAEPPAATPGPAPGVLPPEDGPADKPEVISLLQDTPAPSNNRSSHGSAQSPPAAHAASGAHDLPALALNDQYCGRPQQQAARRPSQDPRKDEADDVLSRRSQGPACETSAGRGTAAAGELSVQRTEADAQPTCAGRQSLEGAKGPACPAPAAQEAQPMDDPVRPSTGSVVAVAREAGCASAARHGRSSLINLLPLQQLQLLCGQQPHAEAADLPTMDDVLARLAQSTQRPTASSSKSGGRAAARAGCGKLAAIKVGEGSYGEAWKLGSSSRAGAASSGGSMVVKVVPIEGSEHFNGGPQKSAADMLSETLMCRALSSLGEGEGASDSNSCANWTQGFVRTHAVAVCRGPYSKELVKAWERWDKTVGSENEPVSRLPSSQLYWVIAMEDSGKDLEKYELAGMDQLCSVLLQVAMALAVAEQALDFEHRDLHWGNILVRPAASRELACKLRGHEVKVLCHGVAATVIDFTQSRLAAPDGALAFCDMAQDPSVFEGPKGDIQFDTYRWMRRLVGDDWSASCPATNCLWLAYLAEVLAQRFGGRGGGWSLSASQKRQLREFRKRAVSYPSCTELIWDELFKGQIAVA